MSMEVEDLILSELKSLNTKLDDLSIDTKQRLTHLETQTKPLFDNGQVGLCNQRLIQIQAVETRTTAIETWKSGLYSWLAGAGSVLALAGALIGGIITWGVQWWFKIHR